MSLTRPLLALTVALALAPLPGRAAEGDAGAYLAARTAAANSDYRDAAFWFTRALVSDPSNPVLLEGLLVGDVSLADFDGAVTVARQMAGLKLNSQTANIVLLADQAKRGDFETMLTDITGGRSIGKLVDGLAVAWAQLGSGKMSEALEGFDQIATSPGLEAFGLYHKALALASVGDFEGADAILSGKVNGKLRMTRRGVIAHAQILSQLERNADALKLLDSTFGTEPDPAVDSLRTLLDAGETLPYDVARNATDGVAEVFFTLGTALNGEAADSYTLVYARVAAWLRPDYTDAILLAASLLEEQKQHVLATETYALIPPDHPSFYVAEIGRADALQKSGKTDEAVAVLQKLAAEQDLMLVHLALGDLLRQEERWPEATAAYDRAIDRVVAPDARHWLLFYSRAITEERQGNFEKADADFRRALELSPDQPQVLNYLGYSMVERGVNLDEALGMIQRAVAAQPDSGYIVDSLAWVLYTLGRYDEAVAPMEQASLLEPVDPIVTDHLGDVYWAVGRKLEAEFQWRRALSYEPTEKDAARIRRKLEIGLDAVLAEDGAAPLAPRPAQAAAGGAAPDGN